MSIHGHLLEYSTYEKAKFYDIYIYIMANSDDKIK